MTRLLLFMIPLITVLSGPVIVLLSSESNTDGPVLVLSNWGNRAEANVAQAGGQIIGPETAAFGVFAASDHPQFSEKLRARGAWLVINSARLAAICGIET